MVYAASFESAGRKQVLSDAAHAVYVRSKSGAGYLLYIRQGSLLAQPFDAGALSLAGEAHLVADMRREIAVAMGAKFGAANIDASGNKAIRIKKLPGSRADVDVVPVFKYHWVWWNETAGQYWKHEGITILSKNGVWTNNFPDQHYANGVAKRARTAHRFKKQVRIFKRLRDELVRELKLSAGRAPSFLVECLTYFVEDAYFLVEADDRYDRTIRILYRMWELLNDPAWTSTATEINGIKVLFHATQPWTVEDAKAYVAVALGQLRV